MLKDLITQLGALDLGIIPPYENIDEALKTMSKEESRKARRKYRKIKRKILKQDPMLEDAPGLIRNQVNFMSYERGRELINE